MSEIPNHSVPLPQDFTLDGPGLFAYTSGCLGTVGVSNAVLFWDSTRVYTGELSTGNLTVAQSVTAGSLTATQSVTAPAGEFGTLSLHKGNGSSENIQFNSSIQMNNNPIYLQVGNPPGRDNKYHYIKLMSGSKEYSMRPACRTFSRAPNIDGPGLFGYKAGCLGTTAEAGIYRRSSSPGTKRTSTPRICARRPGRSGDVVAPRQIKRPIVLQYK